MLKHTSDTKVVHMRFQEGMQGLSVQFCTCLYNSSLVMTCQSKALCLKPTSWLSVQLKSENSFNEQLLCDNGLISFNAVFLSHLTWAIFHLRCVDALLGISAVIRIRIVILLGQPGLEHDGCWLESHKLIVSFVEVLIYSSSFQLPRILKNQIKQSFCFFNKSLVFLPGPFWSNNDIKCKHVTRHALA